MASCDLAYACSATASFGTPGVNIGLFCSTPMVALSRNIPRKAAMEMLLVGEAASCADAVAYGLVNRSVPTPAELDDLVDSVASKIASKSTLTVAVGKKAFYSQLEKGLSDAYKEANVVMTANMMARDAKEGITAFVGKREPSWEDR